VSFANCGLPYYVGNVIEDENKLLVATPELFRDRFNISAQLETEVTEIQPERRVILTRNLQTGEVREECTSWRQGPVAPVRAPCC